MILNFLHKFNPTSSIINIEQDFKTAKVYDISGKGAIEIHIKNH